MTDSKILVKSKSGMRMVAVDGKKGFFELEEPVWTPDGNFRACLACQKMFDMFRRKHHCRRCGEVFCSACSQDKVIPMRLRFIDPVRMCAKCQKVSRWENDFFNNHFKRLKNGVLLNVQTEAGDRVFSKVFLAGDGGILQIVSDEGPVLPVLMDEIVSYRVSQEGSDGVHMLSIDVLGSRNLVLSKTEQQESIQFLNGFRKALRMSAKPDHQKGGTQSQ